MATEYNPTEVSRPGESLLDILEERGITQTELAQRMGRTPKHINEIIKKGVPITPETAIQLERALGGSPPAEFWNRRERRYREWLARAEEKDRLKGYKSWARLFPYPEMVRRSWVEKAKPQDWEEKADQLLRFFGVVSPDAWENVWGGEKVAVAFRRNENCTNEKAAISAWLRQGEIMAERIESRPFDEERFEWSLQAIRTATRMDPGDAERTMIDLCRDAGVVVIRIPKVGRAPVTGATRWLRSDKALIQLSGRGKREDIFWFTFFHEAGHILLHGKREVFLDTNEGTADEADEQEANDFAADFLIPPKEWKSFISRGKYHAAETVKRFAREQEICPAIVVGRLHKEDLIPTKNLHGLIRQIAETSG